MQADIFSILFYITFFVYFSVGAYVIGLNPKSNLNRVFSLTCSALGVWAISLAFANINSGWAMVQYSGLILAGGIFYLLISLIFHFIRLNHFPSFMRK